MQCGGQLWSPQGHQVDQQLWQDALSRDELRRFLALLHSYDRLLTQVRGVMTRLQHFLRLKENHLVPGAAARERDNVSKLRPAFDALQAALNALANSIDPQLNADRRSVTAGSLHPLLSRAGYSGYSPSRRAMPLARR